MKGALISSTKRLDFTGQRFGRLVVTSRAEDKVYGGSKKSCWNCVCDCGATVVVSQNSLVSGATKSCGCWKRDATSDVHTKDLTGVTFGYLTV